MSELNLIMIMAVYVFCYGKWWRTNIIATDLYSKSRKFIVSLFGFLCLYFGFFKLWPGCVLDITVTKVEQVA